MGSIASKIKAQRVKFFCIVLSWFCFSPCCFITVSSATEPFPLYPCIKANVRFWEDVYGRYSTHQGILHDSDNLNRIYTVVDLLDGDIPGAAKINSERIKAAKNRISEILADLGSGKPASTQEQQHIAGLFPRQSQAAYHEARENIRLQIGQKDRFYEGLIRSGKYLAQFKQIFASEGLPTELSYLPHVESSFNPKAFSKVGAAGLWQFTRSTGKDFLTINERVDERYDPYLSTLAAVKLLKENYSQLQSWPLAITAYNYGRAGMVRATNEKGSYENIFNSYSQGYFKFASRNFYSEFLAALRVASRLGGDSKIPFERPEATVTFRLKQDIAIARLRSSFHLSSQNFARLNPAVMPPVLDGQKSVPKGYLVRLPATTQVAMQQTELKAKNEGPQKSAPLPKDTNSSEATVRYKVRKGDTVSSIARQFQLSPRTLLAANSRNRQTDIRIGEQLNIPVNASKNQE
jgi:membrane-bound lytic murein transglycosylase D